MRQIVVGEHQPIADRIQRGARDALQFRPASEEIDAVGGVPARDALGDMAREVRYFVVRHIPRGGDYHAPCMVTRQC